MRKSAQWIKLVGTSVVWNLMSIPIEASIRVEEPKKNGKIQVPERTAAQFAETRQHPMWNQRWIYEKAGFGDFWAEAPYAGANKDESSTITEKKSDKLGDKWIQKDGIYHLGQVWHVSPKLEAGFVVIGERIQTDEGEFSFPRQEIRWDKGEREGQSAEFIDDLFYTIETLSPDAKITPTVFLGFIEYKDPKLPQEAKHLSQIVIVEREPSREERDPKSGQSARVLPLPRVIGNILLERIPISEFEISQPDQGLLFIRLHRSVKENAGKIYQIISMKPKDAPFDFIIGVIEINSETSDYGSGSQEGKASGKILYNQPLLFPQMFTVLTDYSPFNGSTQDAVSPKP